MDKLEKVFDVLNLPLMLMNMLSAIVGGIWLAFLGEWRLVIFGIVILFTSQWLISFMLLPGMLLGAISMYFHEKKNPLFYFFGFINQAYTNFLIIVTCAFAFILCTHFYSSHSKITLIPYLLWSWSIALGDWQYFASKELDNIFTMGTLYVASVLYFLFLVSLFISPVATLIIIAAFMLVHLFILPIFSLYLAAKQERTTH
jgi:hypothetical protein